MIRSMRVLMILLVACGSSDAPPPPRPATAPTVAAPRPGPWTLVISSDYGPCSETEVRPCHTTWTVHPDGIVEKLALPNDPRKQPVATRTTLSPFDRDALRALVARADFHDGMAHGFACQGEAHDPDATLQLAFVDASGARASQYVEHCTRGPDAATALPSQILGLVRR